MNPFPVAMRFHFPPAILTDLKDLSKPGLWCKENAAYSHKKQYWKDLLLYQYFR